jgi:hypothetical protein|tara:strand:+ start:21586 stop:21864 length:279 start_codon:yes stop_codon:yes gene_type:complete
MVTTKQEFRGKGYYGYGLRQSVIFDTRYQIYHTNSSHEVAAVFTPADEWGPSVEGNPLTSVDEAVRLLDNRLLRLSQAANRQQLLPQRRATQ